MIRARKRYDNHTGFNDLLLTIGLLFLIIIFITIITPDTHKETDGLIDPKTAYYIELTWPDGSAADIDLWVLGPDKKQLGYKSKDIGYMSLERDDLGNVNDYFYINGRNYRNPNNIEMALIRTALPGQWWVNVYYYHPYTEKKPVEVKIRFIRMKNYQVLLQASIILSKRDEQRTVTSFVIDNKGRIIDNTYMENLFVDLKSNPKNDGLSEF
jgi:hypothetical protein